MATLRLKGEAMTHYSPTTLGTTPEERENWLRWEVESTMAEQVIRMIKDGQAQWIADPWIAGVNAVQYIGDRSMPNDKIILVVYEHGRDWEFSAEGEDLLMELRNG